MHLFWYCRLTINTKLNYSNKIDNNNISNNNKYNNNNIVKSNHKNIDNNENEMQIERLEGCIFRASLQPAVWA